MQDMRKTKAQLVEELRQLRERIALLESGDDGGANAQQSAPDALRESERKFRSLAESTTAHISIIQDDRYVYANQAFLDHYMLDPEGLPLVTPEDLMMGAMTPETIQQAEAVYKDAIARGDDRIRFEYKDREGSWYQINVTMMELGGRPAFLIMEFDVTELKQAQSEMYRADKMAALGQVVAGVAHEINNPNNFIYFNLPILRKYLQAITPLLEEQFEKKPDLEILGMRYEVFLKDVFKLLENMEYGSKRITGIVSDLKNYLGSDEEQQWKVEPVGEVVKRAMNLVGRQVRKTARRLDVEIAEGLPPVRMIAGKIEQVLINLLINAGHAADKEDSWVKVSALPADDTEDWVELRVEDNGTGIAPDKLERIFEPFFTSKGPDRGTGLGRSISHRIIEEHGGKISVQSKPGEGACFTVGLPAGRKDK